MPYPSSMKNWTSLVNAQGFQTDIFSALSKLSLEDRDCSLIFDSMAIRKQVIWNTESQKYIGNCDYGEELYLEGSDTVATEVY